MNNALNYLCEVSKTRVYTLNQYWGTPFKSAYGALTRVTPEEEKKRIPVNNKTIEELFKYSPKLSELKEFFQNEADGWRECGEKNMK